MKDLYSKLLAWATGGSLFIVFAVVLVASLTRYLFNYPIQWSEEVARYAMIYGAMFGTILCYMQDIHIKFGFMEKISGPVKKVVDILTDLVALSTGVALTWSGYLFVLKRGGIDAPGTGIPMSVFQSAIIVGGVGLVIGALLKLPDHLKTRTAQSDD